MPQSPQQEDDSAQKRPSALARVLTCLAHKSRSEAYLRADLEALDYAEPDIDDAIKRAQGYGYVHDGRLADMVAHAARRRGKGPLWVRMQLAKAKLDPKDHGEALAEASRGADETADAALASKLKRCPRPLDARQRAKGARFLLSRGFSPHTAQRAIDRLMRADNREGDGAGSPRRSALSAATYLLDEDT